MNTLTTRNHHQAEADELKLSSLILWVFTVKIIIFLLDPTVMFFVDDSSRYLDTALLSYIPPDRSFVYGYLIRWLTFWNQSLTVLVFFQVLCSAASAVILGYILNGFLSVRPKIALCFAVLCAIAPIQLMFERYVMTESVSLLCFSLFTVTLFYYLRNPSIWSLVILNFTGVVLIAFRLSYLPIVLSGAIMIPLFPFIKYLIERRNNACVDREGRPTRMGGKALKTCVHLFLSCFLAYGFHSAYKIINGRLSNKPPAYQYCNGFHLISSWAPLLEKDDFMDPAIGAFVLKNVSFDIKDRFQRMNQRWEYDGLTNYICRMYDTRIDENNAAREAALNILRRDPVGVLKLTLQSYLDYWNMELLKGTLQGDRCTRVYPDDLVGRLKSQYHISAEGLNVKKTLTNQYFLNAAPWYWVLFSLPLVIIICLLADKGRNGLSLALLGLFSFLILLNATALVHRNTMRFFHPNEWIAVIFLGVLFDRIMKRKKTEEMSWTPLPNFLAEKIQDIRFFLR